MPRLLLCSFMLVALVCDDAGALQQCGELQANTYVAGVQSAPAVAVDGAGQFVVVWTSDGSAGTDTDDRSIHAQRYDAAGTALGAELQVNTYTTGRQSSPAVAIDTTGRTLVVWDSAGSPSTDTAGLSIQARGFDGAGLPLGAQFQVNDHTTGTQRDPRIVADDDGGFLVVWESDGSPGTDGDSFSVQARRVTVLGPSAAQFQVNAYTTSYQVDPDVGRDGSDGFVVTWVSYGSVGTDDDSTSIQARHLDAAAAPVGGDFQVNGYTTSYQDYPRVGATAAGGFVVTWRSDGSAGGDTDYGSIQARRYDATATPLGAQFQVNVLTTGEQREAAVVGDGAGGFLIAWDADGSVGDDADGWSIQGRRYDATGAPTGGQFQVDQFTTGSQYSPAAAGDGTGRFVVSWRSTVGSGSDPSDAVQVARLDDTSCTTPTSTTSTSSTTSSSSTSTTTSVPSSSTTTSVPSTSSSTVVSTSTSVSSSSSSSTSSSLPQASTSTSTSTVTSTSATTPPSSSSTSTTTATTVTSSTRPDELLSAKKLILVEGRRSRGGRGMVRSRDPALGLRRGPGSPDDPTLVGGSMRIVSLAGAFDVGADLPAAGWKPTKRGYRYRAPDGVRVRLMPGKRLKLRIKGAEFPLGTVPPMPVVVVLRLGEQRLCFEFVDGTLNAKGTKLVAREAERPSSCNEPPPAP
jgi:hypothetical protein